MKKKVFHIITSLNRGGAEAMLVKLLAAMQANDYEFTVIALHCKNNTEHMYYTQKIQALGIKVHQLHLSKKTVLQTAKQVYKLLSSNAPDIVQTWLYYADFLGGWCAKFAGVKKIIWNLRCEGRGLSLPSSLAKFLCALSARIVPTYIMVNSQLALCNHVLAGYPEKKMRLIYNGFESDLFKALPVKPNFSLFQQQCLPENAVLIGTLGRYHENKDYPSLIQAIDSVCEYNKNVYFVLCGTDCQTSNATLMQHLNQLHYKQQVILLNGTNQVTEYLNCLDIFMLSSHTESFPNVLAEAMLCERCCVSTDVGEAKHILGEAGLVIPTKQPQKIAEACIALLEKTPEQRAELGKLARQRIIQFFSMATFVASVKALYENEVN